MKFSVVCSPGLGDAVILHIVSHHLRKAGHEVITVTPHRFGKWADGFAFGPLETSDAIFLQYDNSPHAKILHSQKNIYTFFGSHNFAKHGPLKEGFDFVADLNQPMVANIVACLKSLFGIDATPDNGLHPPKGLIHRRYPKRIAIHAGSGDPQRNWPLSRFTSFAKWAKNQGFDPLFLPQFATLEELFSFLFESGYFLGNDSGPGHIASSLNIPNLIIGKEEKHMRHWRPGWLMGPIITPPKWIPNWKGLRIREKYWRLFIAKRSVIKLFKTIVSLNK